MKNPQIKGKIDLPKQEPVRLDANDILKDYRKRLDNYKNVIVRETKNKEINKNNIELALVEISLIKNSIVVLKDYIDNNDE